MEQLKNLDLNQFMNNLNSMDIDKLAIATVLNPLVMVTDVLDLHTVCSTKNDN